MMKTTNKIKVEQGAHEAGFSLIEVMVAIVITGLLFTGFFSVVRTAMTTQVIVREFSDAERAGPAILSQISKDLHNAYFYNIENNHCFEGKAIERDQGARMDQIHFLTTRTSLAADPSIPSNENREIGVGSPVTEVSYILREGRDGFYELCRRESPFVDDEPFKGGYYRLISDRILSFKLQYTGWDFGQDDEGLGALGENSRNDRESNDNVDTRRNEDENNDNSESDDEDEDGTGELVWEDDWSASDRNSIPVAVKIEMVIAPDVDPSVLKRLEYEGRADALEKSYLDIILLPQFREEPEATRGTYDWDGRVAEPGAATTGGGARGARGAPNGREGNAAGGRGGRGGRGGNQGGRGTRGQPRPNALPLGGNNRGGNGGGANRIADILRGGGR